MSKGNGPLLQVLVKAHTDIIPHLTNPHLLADFLTRVLDAGGLTGMLALHGIFTLVTKHGLEYPYFYCRLYNLLTPAALMVRQLPIIMIKLWLWL
jgi:U3 small nucleolar RNA-associated protein 19